MPSGRRELEGLKAGQKKRRYDTMNIGSQKVRYDSRQKHSLACDLGIEVCSEYP